MIEILEAPERTYIDCYIEVIARCEQGMIYHDEYAEDEEDKFTCYFYQM